MAAPDLAIWEGILVHLRRQHVGLCRRWFDEIEFVGVDSGMLCLRVPQDARRAYLERECMNAFAEAAQSVSGMLLAVRFMSDDEPEPYTNGPVAPPAASARASTRSDQLVISPDYTFDNFVVGPENRLAHAAAVAVANNPGRAYNPVFLHGGVGLGKTHLLQAICSRILERTPDALIYYVSCESFITQFMDSVQGGMMNEFRHRFRDVDVLVIDDIHFLAKRDRTQEEFFHTFNSLFQANKQIVLSSDAPPDQIPDLEERLVSRFKWGLVAELEPPGYDTRVAIVSKKAALRGVPMPDEVARLIASRVDSNIRELEGAIVRVQMQAMVDNAPVTEDLAQSVLKDLPSRHAHQITIDVIVDAVSDFYSVKFDDLRSKRRQKSIAHPRQLCMFLARRHTAHSLEEIGERFGGRDHTTVMHAVRAIASRMDEDPTLADIVKALEERIRRRA